MSSKSDGMEDDDAMSSNLPHPFLKGLVAAAIAAASIRVVPGGGGAHPLCRRGRGIAGSDPPATSVHSEALEITSAPTPYPPIHQCQNGHTLCSTCKAGAVRCPTYGKELGDIRCLALEKVAESLELPCKYYSLGCQTTLYITRSECSVVGDIPFLVSHLRDDHEVDMHSGCTFNHRYVKSNPRSFPLFGQYFCLHFEAFQLRMAPEDDMEARLEHRDSHRKVRDSHYSHLIIQRNMALFFSGGGEKS
ncbi:hypothetical protein ZWY2020_016941 [Hordeum vulgare]|nr:hypothetical protein ZWY2020_016941 [Hordeum vulgare]